MSTTPLDICNRALGHCKADPIPDLSVLTAGNTEEARLCNLWLDPTKREVLRSHPWNTCKDTQPLTLTPTTPSTRYTFQYHLPPKCLRVLAINEIDPPAQADTHWQIVGTSEGKFLECDDSPALCEYIFDQEYSRLDDLCLEMIEIKLASKLCYPLTGKDKRARELLEYYIKVIKGLARSIDAMEANQERPNKFRHSSWRRARYGR